MEPVLATLSVILTLIVGSMLFWLFPLKLLVRLRRRIGETVPCPYRFGWVLDLRLRRWVYRNVLDRVGLRSGMVALEVGAGTGTFAIRAARRVGPGGKVIAVDLQPEMVAKLEKKVQHAGITNVVTYLAGAYELPLEDASVDCVFFITVLGEIADPQRALCEAHRVLKDGGVISITEEFSDPDYNWPRETVRLIEQAGFEATQRLGSLWLYTLNGRKTESMPPGSPSRTPAPGISTTTAPSAHPTC